jgi:hypothetical protein
MYQLELVTDFPLKSLNRSLRTHYHARNSYNKEWYNLIYWKTRSNLPPTPLERADLYFTRSFYRFMDNDNLTASLKPVVDGLVRAGVIKDDTWRVTGQWKIDQIFLPKRNGHMLCIKVIGRDL